MKLSKLSTAIGLSLVLSCALSINAKTLIVDDFLKYQDTSNMHFDFAKPIQGVSSYETQFMVESELDKCGFWEISPNYDSDEAYNLVKGCKEEDLDRFQAKRHKEAFRDAYANEYYDYVNKVRNQLQEIDEIKINGIVNGYFHGNYNIDTEVYDIQLFDEFFSHYYFNDKIKGTFRKYLRGDNGRGEMVLIGNVCRLDHEHISFTLPLDIAEKIETNDGAFIVNVTMGVKIENDLAIMKDSYYAPSESAQCFIKEVNVSVVEKNELYNAKALSLRASPDPLWRNIKSLMENQDNISLILAQINDKRVIYSTNKVEVKNKRRW